MSREILDNFSFQLLRTNPKLTTNVKLVVNSDGKLFLDSFDANSQISASEFKAFEIAENSSYSYDIFNFYQQGQFPKNLAFGVKESFSNQIVGETYGGQYDTTYISGAQVLTSTAYNEDFSVLAPLWLDEELPEAFVIVRLNGPLSVNEVLATSETENIAQINDASYFSEFVLNNSTVIKTFDLTKNSKIGKYLRKHIDDPNYPAAPFMFQYNKETPVKWQGISYTRGGFSSSDEYAYEELITKENSIIETEYFITTGFERTGIICANLMNLQFLFSDETANDYEINRYFGLYVNKVSEGTFRLAGSEFYYGAKNDKDQTPVPPSTNYVSDTLSTKFEISNPNGVLLYYDPATLTKYTDFYDGSNSAYTPSEVQQFNSFFYVNDKNDNIYEIKRGSGWGSNQLRLSNTSIDVSQFVGFDQTSFNAKAEVLVPKGKASAKITMLSNPPDGANLFFYRNGVLEGSISSEADLTIPGENSNNFFSPFGTPLEIATAMYNAIAFVSPDSRSFDVVREGANLYFISRFTGTPSNQIYIVLQNFGFNQSSIVSSFPAEVSNQINFTGGTDFNSSRIKVSNLNVDGFEVGKYLKTSTGFAQITSISLYVDEAVRNSDFVYTSIPNVDSYYCVNTDNKNLITNSTGYVILYDLFVPNYGRLSIVPVKDFDFDFYSTFYSDLGELEVERDWYTDSSNPLSYHPDIENFYLNGGFTTLEPLLPTTTSTLSAVNPILSEYDRLNENFTKELVTSSRVVPFINKWGYFDYGKDTRNKAYRFDMSRAFGNFNFAPVGDVKNRDAYSLTHEWYLLSKIPDYFTSVDAKRSWSYFSDVLSETDIKNVVLDKFKEYFIVDSLTLYDGSEVAVDRQLRYASVYGGNSDSFAQTFFRGSKIVLKQRATSNSSLNFDVKTTAFVKNERFNDYRFSAVLVPTVSEEPNFKIKFIENKKWKTVTMFIYLYINEECFDLGENIVDRTMLYALNSKILAATGCDYDTLTGNNIDYGDPRIDGALDPTYAETTITGDFIIKGVKSNFNDSTPNFLRQIKVNSVSTGGSLTGAYPNILFSISTGSAAGSYRIFNVKNVLTEDKLTCQAVQKWNGTNFVNVSWPPVLGGSSFRSVELFLEDAGFNAFADRFLEASFGNILTNVNEGAPSIDYTTVSETGAETTNEFAVELISPNVIQKPIYLTSIQDPDKPVQFNLVDTVGYRLFLNQSVQITPFYRHFGLYAPIFVDIFKFVDPYVGELIPTGSTYEDSVKNFFRYKNTQLNVSDPLFGIIQNLFYHKANEQTPASVIQLSTQSAYKALYPLITETAIDKRDFYVFRSSWDPGYFVKNLSSGLFELKAGTRNQLEKKSFMASKIMKTPSTLRLETFNPSPFNKNALFDNTLVTGDVMFEGDGLELTIDLYALINKAATSYLFDEIYTYFEKYINPLYSFSDEQSIADDVNSYITNNIIPVYKIENINLYIKKVTGTGTVVYSTLQLNDQQKIAAGFAIDKNAGIQFPVPNSLDFQVIYNIDKGYDYSVGLSVTLSKK